MLIVSFSSKVSDNSPKLHGNFAPNITTQVRIIMSPINLTFKFPTLFWSNESCSHYVLYGLSGLDILTQQILSGSLKFTTNV